MKSKIKPPPNWEDTPQSFKNFERLAKALMATTKKEPDKETAKGERPKHGTRRTKKT